MHETMAPTAVEGGHAFSTASSYHFFYVVKFWHPFHAVVSALLPLPHHHNHPALPEHQDEDQARCALVAMIACFYRCRIIGCRRRITLSSMQ
mmetsp:Transcript_24439/g.48794  ORF Transcript_24439/g.48794 Transcript_24439/m.48794 type:complete len:92 (-) Transcript_24439:66-341(-)